MMKIKQSDISKSISLLRNITSDYELNTTITDQFLASGIIDYYEEKIYSENIKQAEKIALKFKALSNETGSDSFVEFCNQFNLAVIEETDKVLTLVRRDTLTTYKLENRVVTVSHFQGDGFFRSPVTNRFKGQTEVQSEVQFFLELFNEFKQENNPIKKRLLGFSMHQMDKKYRIHFRATDDYYFVFFDKTLFVYNTVLDYIGSVPIKIQTSSFQAVLGKFRTVNRTSTSIFILITFIIMSSILQFNVVAPYIDFEDYTYTIGDEFLISNIIGRVYDDNDPIRIIADNTPISSIQNQLNSINRQRLRITYDRDQINLNIPGMYKLDIIVSDGVHSRTQSVMIRVEE
jgi:hypothetical protein